MSDQNFSGGGIATQEPPSEAPEPSATGSRRNLVVVAVAVVAALAVAAWFLFLSGGSSAAPASVVPHVAGSGAANGAGNGKVTAGAPAKGGATPVKPAAVRDKNGRDPFAPLLTVATASPSPSDVAPTSAPSDSASVPAAPTATPTASVPASGNVVATVSLTSVDTKAKTATFNVTPGSGKATKYAGVGVGDNFATFFKLFDLGSKCAQVEYGDQTGSVCTGGQDLVLYSN